MAAFWPGGAAAHWPGGAATRRRGGTLARRPGGAATRPARLLVGLSSAGRCLHLRRPLPLKALEEQQVTCAPPGRADMEEEAVLFAPWCFGQTRSLYADAAINELPGRRLLFVVTEKAGVCLFFKETRLTHVEVKVDDLKNKAQEYEIYDLRPFFSSPHFSDNSFVLDEGRGIIRHPVAV